MEDMHVAIHTTELNGTLLSPLQFPSCAHIQLAYNVMYAAIPSGLEGKKSVNGHTARATEDA